ncbi:MAG: hypothetical protein WC184_13215 [Acidimicrobiia bacterium]
MTVLTSDAIDMFENTAHYERFTDEINMQDEGASPRYLLAAEAVLQDLHQLDVDGHLNGKFRFEVLAAEVHQMVDAIKTRDYPRWYKANTNLCGMVTRNGIQASLKET